MNNLGTTEEITQCDCCGKSNLKKTVVFESECGEILYYGVVCASKVMNQPVNKIKEDAKIADSTRKIEELMSNTFGDNALNKLVLKAEKLGCDMNKLFVEFGKIIMESSVDVVYAIGTKTHSIHKSCTL